MGLTAKNPKAKVSVARHVATGSRKCSSQFISTCSTRRNAENLRQLKIRSNCRDRRKDLVRIDVATLPNKVQMYGDSKQKMVTLILAQKTLLGLTLLQIEIVFTLLQKLLFKET